MDKKKITKLEHKETAMVKLYLKCPAVILKMNLSLKACHYLQNFNESLEQNYTYSQ